MVEKLTPTRPDITIRPAADGEFYVVDGRDRVWDGEEWRGFGAAEKYASYSAAMAGRRAAIAKASGVDR